MLKSIIDNLNNNTNFENKEESKLVGEPKNEWKRHQKSQFQ